MGAQPYVYFLRPVGAAGPVKIGCSVRPRDRLEVFLHLAPFPLEIAATIPGDFEIEGRFHTLFADTHSHHEWFSASPELTGVIDQINAGSFDVDNLPVRGKRVGAVLRRPWSDAQRQGARLGHGLRHIEKRGIKVPREVSEAEFRFSSGRYHGEVSHNPQDAALVEAFIALHPAPTTRKVRLQPKRAA